MSLIMSYSFHFFLLLLLLSKFSNFEEIREPREKSNLVDYSAKFIKKPMKGKLDMKMIVPKIPKHIQVYIAVAFAERDFLSYSKIFNKTLSSIPSSFLIDDSRKRHYNISISPLYFVLPDSGRFSSSIFEVMCSSFDKKRVVAIFVIGESPAAFTVSLAATTSNIPVLWARGGAPSPPGSLLQHEALEIRLETGEKQLLEAVRGVLLATHWHSFTVMAPPSLATRCASILNQPPLSPKVVSFMRNPHAIFRKLADVSRSTRGVILLLCDLPDAILVMDVAKKLNMIDGHFVWIWIDTTAKPAPFLTPTTPPNQNFTQKFTRFNNKTSKVKDNQDGFSYQGGGFRVYTDINFKDEEYFEELSRNIKKREAKSGAGSEDLNQEIQSHNELNKTVENGTGGVEQTNKNDQNDKKVLSQNVIKERQFLKSNFLQNKNSNGKNDTDKNNLNNNNNSNSNSSIGSSCNSTIISSSNNSISSSSNNSAITSSDSNSIISSSNSSVSNSSSSNNGSVSSSNSNNGSVSSSNSNNSSVSSSSSSSSNNSSVSSSSSNNSSVSSSSSSNSSISSSSNNSSDNNNNKNNNNNHHKDDNNKNKNTKNSDMAKQSSSQTSKVLDSVRINAQRLKQPGKVQNTKSYDTSTTKEAERWEDLASMDYLNDFAANLMDYRKEKEVEQKDEIPAPVSKMWGKITEHFPLHSSNKNKQDESNLKDTDLPIGLLSVKPEPLKLDRHLIKGSVRLLVSSLHTVLKKRANWLSILDTASSCWIRPSPLNKNFSETYAKEIRKSVKEALSGQLQFQEADRADRSLMANFQILNLVPEKFNVNFYKDVNVIKDAVLHWRQVGKVVGTTAQLDTIVWPGGDLVASALSARTKSVFRIVTALAPPFVMEGALDEDGQCLRGIICHRVLNSDKDNLTLVFNEMDTQERMEDEVEEMGGDEDAEKPFRFFDPHYFEFHNKKHKYKSSCCYGLSMDLLENIAQELEFEFHLYIVPDGAYGAKSHVWEEGVSRTKWNGIVGDLVSGAAHMSFAALSVSKQRSQVIDFSTPYFYGGVSFLAAPNRKSEVPLLAFLLPFSPELWIAIFTSLNITALAVACYEWLSPFGLNPWGRQRSRNFSIASALWVMWGLLCGHLVSFKAPKSWPNKFLINIWGGFSVIFVASYTANIAALIAGLLFHNSVNDYRDRSLLTQRVAAPKYSSAEYYIRRANQHLWEHMQKYSFKDVETGIAMLRNGSLDILIADTPILDYYRATDHGCKLQKIIDTITEDTYAIGMNKGFPLKESISALISKYSNNGYMDILTEKWYGGLPCFKMSPSVELTDIGQPRPLGVAAVAGVFLLLGLGVVAGVLILIVEHLFYRHMLPVLRRQPSDSIWKSRNIMFFSQKLYRFINCVELVSPHHAARELARTLRRGQITSLFQKSVRRKEREQRRRRKSKAQFFEMIQEIRRRQQENGEPMPSVSRRIESPPRRQLRGFLTSPRSLKHFCSSKSSVSPQLSIELGEPLKPSRSLQQRRPSKPPSRLNIRRFSRELFSLPRSPRTPKAKSSTSLDIRKFKLYLEEKRKREEKKEVKEVQLTAKQIKMRSSKAIGKRLSRESSPWLAGSPPDFSSRRKSHLDIMHTKSFSISENVLDDTPKSTLDLQYNYSDRKRYYGTDYGKEFWSKRTTLNPVISRAAATRLASSGIFGTLKSIKTRPRFPSPPESPVMDFKSLTTPKISISDADETQNIYDTILPKVDSSPEKPTRSFHSRSRSLDNKHLSFGTTSIDIETPDEKNKKVDKQTVSYAILDHSRSNFGEQVKTKSVNEKLKKVSASKDMPISTEGKSHYKKKVSPPVVDIPSTSGMDFTSAKYKIKSADGKRETAAVSPRKASKTTDHKSMYAEPTRPKREKKEGKTTPLKKSMEEKTEHSATTKPRVSSRGTSKQRQARASSAPEPRHKPSATVIFLHDDTQIFPEYSYYSDKKKFQKFESFPDKCRQLKCMQRSFETFPTDKRCTESHADHHHHHHHHHHYRHRTRKESGRQYEMTRRSRSMPEQRYIITVIASKPKDHSSQRAEKPVIVVHHCSRPLETLERSSGTSKSRRRSKSRERADLASAPPSPLDRRRRYERSDSNFRREPLALRRGSQEHSDPP